MGMNQCQSCGMPLKKGELGTNADGTPNEEYCPHCYQKGEYVHNVSMEEMINLTLPYMVKAGLPEQAAKSMLEKGLPMLKRWKN